MTKRDWGIDEPDEMFWYNTRTKSVEEGKQSLSLDRVGPFATRDEALRAPQILAERAREWAEEEASEG